MIIFNLTLRRNQRKMNSYLLYLHLIVFLGNVILQFLGATTKRILAWKWSHARWRSEFRDWQRSNTYDDIWAPGSSHAWRYTYLLVCPGILTNTFSSFTSANLVEFLLFSLQRPTHLIIVMAVIMEWIVSPQKIGWNPNTQYLRTWPYLNIVVLQV